MRTNVGFQVFLLGGPELAMRTRKGLLPGVCSDMVHQVGGGCGTVSAEVTPMALETQVLRRFGHPSAASYHLSLQAHTSYHLLEQQRGCPSYSLIRKIIQGTGIASNQVSKIHIDLALNYEPCPCFKYTSWLTPTVSTTIYRSTK